MENLFGDHALPTYEWTHLNVCLWMTSFVLLTLSWFSHHVKHDVSLSGLEFWSGWKYGYKKVERDFVCWGCCMTDESFAKRKLQCQCGCKKDDQHLYTLQTNSIQQMNVKIAERFGNGIPYWLCRTQRRDNPKCRHDAQLELNILSITNCISGTDITQSRASGWFNLYVIPYSPEEKAVAIKCRTSRSMLPASTSSIGNNAATPLSDDAVNALTDSRRSAFCQTDRSTSQAQQVWFLTLLAISFSKSSSSVTANIFSSAALRRFFAASTWASAMTWWLCKAF